MIDYHEQARQSALHWRRLRLWVEALQAAKRLLILTHIIAAWLLLAVIMNLNDQLIEEKTIAAVIGTVQVAKTIEEQSWRCRAYGGKAVTTETTIKLCTKVGASELR